jgi:hypothetical protein
VLVLDDPEKATRLPEKRGASSRGDRGSIRVPSTLRNCASQAGCTGHAGAVTRTPSVTAWSTGMSAYLPPARVTSGPHAGPARRVRAALQALHDAGRGQHLRAVADRRDRLLRPREVLNDLDDPGVEADVLGSAPAGDDEGVVAGLLHLVEREVEGEVVPAAPSSTPTRPTAASPSTRRSRSRARSRKTLFAAPSAREAAGEGPDGRRLDPADGAVGT